MARAVQGLNPKDLRGLIDDGKRQVGSGIVAIVGVTEDGKAGLAVGVTDDLTGTYNAVDLVKVGAAALGGKGGGGRPDMAQAGGPDGSKAQAALEAIEARWRVDGGGVGQTPTSTAIAEIATIVRGLTPSTSGCCRLLYCAMRSGGTSSSVRDARQRRQRGHERQAGSRRRTV